MTPHLNAEDGAYAEAVLLPGDPLRAKWIAETFLTDAIEVNSVRNCLGFTGTYKGQRVSVQATGMGQPSLGIYTHELITAYGVKTLIRVGTCGALNAKINVRDIVIATAASTDSSIPTQGMAPFNYAPAGDFGLARRAAEIAEDRRLPWHAGPILSSDVFYRPEGLDAFKPMIDHGVLAVEMEAATLYTLAARHGVRAIGVCGVSDSLITGEEIDSDARATTLNDLADLCLTLAVTG
jgi:purine-nucleoside phosphorylase